MAASWRSQIDLRVTYCNAALALSDEQELRFLRLGSRLSMGNLGEEISIWIACRSNRPNENGNVWAHPCKFTRVEVPPLIGGRNSRANLEELVIELVNREYKMDSSFSLNLLVLDREIYEMDLTVKAVGDRP